MQTVRSCSIVVFRGGKHIQVTFEKVARTVVFLSRMIGKLCGQRGSKRRFLMPTIHSTVLYGAYVCSRAIGSRSTAIVPSQTAPSSAQGRLQLLNCSCFGGYGRDQSSRHNLLTIYRQSIFRLPLVQKLRQSLEWKLYEPDIADGIIGAIVAGPTMYKE